MLYRMPALGKSRATTSMVTITDEAGDPRFELGEREDLEGPPYRRVVMTLSAPGGDELAVLKRILPAHYAYDIVIGGEQAARVVHHNLPRPHYDLRIRDDHLRVLYRRPLYSVGSEAIRATVWREGAGRNKKIAVKIADGEDPVLLLAVVEAIEVAHHVHVRNFLP